MALSVSNSSFLSILGAFARATSAYVVEVLLTVRRTKLFACRLDFGRSCSSGRTAPSARWSQVVKKCASGAGDARPEVRDISFHRADAFPDVYD